MSPEPARPAPAPAPAPPPRFIRKVVDLRPGDRIPRTTAVARVIRTSTSLIVETDDGTSRTYELAGDPAIEVE